MRYFFITANIDSYHLNRQAQSNFFLECTSLPNLTILIEKYKKIMIGLDKFDQVTFTMFNEINKEDFENLSEGQLIVSLKNE